MLSGDGSSGVMHWTCGAGHVVGACLEGWGAGVCCCVLQVGKEGLEPQHCSGLSGKGDTSRSGGGG